MKKLLVFLWVILAVVACDYDTKKVKEYIENNVADHEVSVVGDVVKDSVFCPMSELDIASNSLLEYQARLLSLLEENPDSAFAFARKLQGKMAQKDAFANMAYPKGKKNRLAYMVKCNVDGKERMVSFFKGVNDENIEMTSLDLDDTVDSLMVSYGQLINGIKVILEGQSER